MVTGGGAPIYAGSAADLRERAGHHRLKLSRCGDIRTEDIMMVPLPTSSTAGALYAEAGLIAAFEPVWNALWLAGFGSKARGAVRAGKPPSPWAQLHPLRGETSTLTPADLGAVRDTVREYVARSMPEALTMKIDPTRRPRRDVGPVLSGLRLVTLIHRRSRRNELDQALQS